MSGSRRIGIPAYVYAPAQCVDCVGQVCFFVELGQGSIWPAFVFTHRVSVPNSRKPAPVLGLRAIVQGELLFLGSVGVRARLLRKVV